MKTNRTIAIAGLAAAGIAAAQPALAGAREREAFFAAGYNDCDARVLAFSWNESKAGMIDWAGDKILREYKDQVEENLRQGRVSGAANAQICPAEEFYSADDIRALADYWDESRKDAVRSISLKLVQGEKQAVDDALAEIRG